MAHTTGLDGAQSADYGHRIELKTQDSTVTKYLPDLPGDDYKRDKGDLWKLSILGFFELTGCIGRRNITGIAIVEGSNDGWNIDSVVTYAVYAHRRYRLLSVDFDVNKWIDGDTTERNKRLQLTLV